MKGTGLKILVLLPVVVSALSAAAQSRVEVTIEDCRRWAEERSVSMRNADLDVEAARMQREEARAEYFPRVSAVAFGFYSLDPMLDLGVKDILQSSTYPDGWQTVVDIIEPVLGDNFRYRTLQRGAVASLTLMQPLFAGGRIVAGNKLAVLGVEAARLQRSMAGRASDEQIDKWYRQVVALQEKQATLVMVEMMLDTIYRDVRSARDAGLASSTDVMQVELKRSELRVGRLQLENGIRLAKMNVLNTIGMEYSYVDRGVDSVPSIDSVYFAGGLSDLSAPEVYYVPEEEVAVRQEEMRLLELSVEAKRLERRMVLGEALPQVAVGAGYGYSYMLDKGDWNGAVFATVQVPLSDWGKTARKMQRYDRQIEKAENERGYLSEQILLQVRQLWLNLTSAWEQMQVTRESVVVAETNVGYSMAYYREGMVSVSELLQAQTQLQSAREAYTEQALNYATALDAYLYRTGSRD